MGNGAMSVSGTSGAELTTKELHNLRSSAAFMVPADAAYGVPGADDETIFADIVASLGRDAQAVRTALATLQEIAGEDLHGMDAAKAEAAAMALLGRDDPAVKATGRAVLQCYYRDDRVLRSPRHRTGGAVSEGAPAGTRRLVAARRRARTATDVARRSVSRVVRDVTCLNGTERRAADRRHGRRSDHRRRRPGCGYGMEPGRYTDAHPVPGTRRLDETHRFPRTAATGGSLLCRLRHQPQPPQARHRLSGQRRQLDR